MWRRSQKWPDDIELDLVSGAFFSRTALASQSNHEATAVDSLLSENTGGAASHGRMQFGGAKNLVRHVRNSITSPFFHH